VVALVDLRKAIDIAVRVRISIQCKCVLPLFSPRKMRPRAALIVLGQLVILSKSIHLCVNTEDTLDTLNLMWTLWTVSKPPFSLSRESDFQFSFFHKRI
jgi:hypothetical protein